MSEPRLLLGNEACALGALAAGCRFYAGYPITPSSEIAETMAELLPAHGGVFVQMEDEIASLAACLGAALGGMKAMTATSGPGFSLMQEHIGFAAMAELPCVIVDVMRGGPSTGLPTLPSQADMQQARWGTHGDHSIIVLAPASVREVYDLTVRAFACAERFRTPVIVLYDAVVGHLRERVELPEQVEVTPRMRPRGSSYRPYAAAEGDVAPLAAFGDGHRFHVTGLAHDERGFPTQDPAAVAALQRRLVRKIEDHRDEIVRCEQISMEDAEVAVVAFGIAARAAREAIRQARQQGLRVGLVRPLTLWPFPDGVLSAAAAHVRA
ncbi:MAG: 2-oxoacid:acceptor oxidoreductase subunit alpha, partial [Armatimonadota bacterium]|nr:2-oxoacid:acceptor oxidoreductase subunit alpha [Armatimonadota bacterium]